LPNSDRQHQSGERAILVMAHPADAADPAETLAPETKKPVESVPAAETVNSVPEESSGTPGKSTPVAVRN